MRSLGERFLIKVREKVGVFEVAEPSEPSTVEKFVAEEEQHEKNGLE